MVSINSTSNQSGQSLSGPSIPPREEIPSQSLVSI